MTSPNKTVRKRWRTIFWIALAGWVALDIYVISFLFAIQCVHVSYYGTSDRPQFVMYASAHSELINRVGHVFYWPLIAMMERVAEIEYVEEPTNFEGGSMMAWFGDRIRNREWPRPQPRAGANSTPTPAAPAAPSATPAAP